MPITAIEVYDATSRRKRGRVEMVKRVYKLSGLANTSGLSYAEQVNNTSAINRAYIAISGYPLFYEDEEMSLAGEPQGQAKVTVTYILRLNGTGLEEEMMGLAGEISGSLKYVQTPFLADGATPIEVSHTWPSNATQTYANGNSKAGTTETQAGRITYPKQMISARGPIFRRRTRDQIITMAEQISGKVNSSTFLAKAARTWLAQPPRATIVDSSVTPWLWQLDLQFDYDDETWDNDTTAVFIDQSTGQPPASLVAGTGIKKIERIAAADFAGVVGT